MMKRFTISTITIMVLLLAVTVFAAPTNSAWDGSVYQVEDWCNKYLKDPDSRSDIDWYAVTFNAETGYMCRYQFRAKNGFGGYTTNDYYFFMDTNSPHKVYTVMERDGTIIF